MKTRYIPLLLVSTFTSTSIFAIDARAIAMGGTGVTAGVGISGVMQNPALLMKQQLNKEKFSFRVGLGAAVRDNNDLVQTADDLDQVINDLDAEVTRLQSQSIPLTCNTSNPDNSAVCLTGMSNFRHLADQTSTLLGQARDKPINLGVNLDLGFAVPAAQYPFAFNAHAAGVVAAKAVVSAEDQAYINEFSTAQTDINTFTVGDLKANSHIHVLANTLQIDAPDDTLTSQADVAALIRQEISISTAHTFDIRGRQVHIGVTPKFAKLTTANITQSLRSNNNDADTQDQFDASRKDTSVFTLDVGGLMDSRACKLDCVNA